MTHFKVLKKLSYAYRLTHLNCNMGKLVTAHFISFYTEALTMMVPHYRRLDKVLFGNVKFSQLTFSQT